MSGRLPPLGLSEALAEVRRALVPGGVAVLATPALWNGPAAPQLLYAEPDAPPTARVLPDWAHLLLEPREISWYLRITRGPLVARLLLEGWWATPSATEAAAREALGRSGLHILKLVPMLSFATPSTPLAAALRDASKDSARPRIERFAIALERRREDRHSA